MSPFNSKSFTVTFGNSHEKAKAVIKFVIDAYSPVLIYTIEECVNIDRDEGIVPTLNCGTVKRHVFIDWYIDQVLCSNRWDVINISCS